MYYDFKAYTNRGFALISTLLVMSLLLVVGVAMLSFSSVEVASATQLRHQEAAKDNAKLALMIAIGRLQEEAGSDQRVTARAAILEDADGSSPLANRNWLGVWTTTYEYSGRQWPIIGKGPDLEKKDEPYAYKGIYSDLRFQRDDLKADRWKGELHKSWMVSSPAAGLDPREELDPAGMEAVEMLGRGTLGDVSVMDEDAYLSERVVVPKVEVDRGGTNGAFAWYISDNSQKASLGLVRPDDSDSAKALMASSLDNPSAVKHGAGNPYQNYLTELSALVEKVISRNSASLVLSGEGERQALKEALGAHYHHFTIDSSGLFTDPVYGGYKRDLSALLFGAPGRQELSFTPPNSELADHPFSSRYPIIPGERKAAQGPSFAALRDWGLLKYVDGLTDGSISADLDFSRGSTRISPSVNWAQGMSDGKTFDVSKWAGGAPKIHPVMTDCRWHFYFSYTGSGANKKMLTHIMPRVCLWNPYSVDLEIGELAVLMANPFGHGSGEKAFHFLLNEEEKRRIQEKFPDDEKVQNWSSSNKIRLGGTRKSNKDRLFPSDPYLGFVIESSVIKAGECIVCSPLISSPYLSSGADEVGLYDKNNIANNVLSAKAEQGKNHFVHECENHNFDIRVTRLKSGKMRDSWLKLAKRVVDEMKFSEIYRYEPWVKFDDNLPFVLKDGRGASGSVAQVVNSQNSLQLINSGSIGPNSSSFWFYASWWGDSGAQFGNLAHFEDTGTKAPNALHQVGVKLLWLDESHTEGNSIDQVPLRSGAWSSDSLAYNPAMIANWNVRPNLITRSPSSPVGQVDGYDTWYAAGAGAWLLQFAPKSPQDFNDAPFLNDEGDFVKPPLGLATQSGFAQSVVMFDLPDSEIGALSLGQLRHAKLSPYSWHPTYIIGSSLVDLHAPYDASSHFINQDEYSGTAVNTSWDEAIGGSNKGRGPFEHGARKELSQTVFSDGLLQIGSQKTSVSIDEVSVSSGDEHLAYDIAYEVNVNLWDHYFISGMPLNEEGSAFEWSLDGSAKLKNLRYEGNHSIGVDAAAIESELSSGLDYGFWINAYLLRNKGAFNVNSTSEEAWFAFLSGLRGIDRRGVTAGDHSIYSRVAAPQNASLTDDVGVERAGGWRGGRKLSDDELRGLAASLVREVKIRGPFLSMSDFVNRRLADKADPTSMNGTIEAAIIHSGINDKLNDARYLTTTVDGPDNNSGRYKPDVDKQPKAKVWGIPGFITQSDILEPLAPALTVRGDTFVIRCYGESKDEAGEIQAVVYMEAVVERTADYVVPASVSDVSLGVNSQKNRPTDPALLLDRVSGELKEGKLSAANKKYGRRFKIKSVRYLNRNEI